MIKDLYPYLLSSMIMSRLQSIPISDLNVSSFNPRFDPVQDQDQAIQLMLNQESEGIKKLAEDIVKHGINPTKSLAVCSENGKFIALEGNRRVVALKLLNNPSIAQDEKLRNFFAGLNEKHRVTRKIMCVVFKDRDAAKHWIELEHTGRNEGAGVDPWDPIQKDRFLGIPSKRVQILDYVGDEIDSSKVDKSSLDRLISTPLVRKTIGISFQKNKLKEIRPRTEIIKNLTRTFSAMSDKEFTVSKIYTSELRKKWIKQTLESEPQNNETTTNPQQRTKTLPKSTSRSHLIPDDCELIIKNTRINDIFRELRDDLPLGDKNPTPNAAGALFRVFLETSLDQYITTMNVSCSEEPTLKKKIELVADHMNDNKFATPKQLKAIRRTSSAKRTDVLHIQTFHEYIHSSTMRPETADLKNKWDNLQKFFEILWDTVNHKN